MQRCLTLLALSTALTAHASLAEDETGTEKADASPPSAGRRVDFERDIRPIFAEHCTKCHGDKRQRGGYRLDGRAGAVRGGDSGEAAIVPGRGSESRLFRLVAGLEPDLTMPPKGPRLDAQRVGLLRAWIDQGAEWPEVPIAGGPKTHWSLTPLARPPVPKTGDSDWARGPIDAFVRAGLARKGLAPAPEADRRTLIRRLSFDLIGLPPTPEEIEDFLDDTRPDAYECLVDRLLESPRHGERWARHWMDAVHFAETHGHDQDRPRPNAWPYRDYLIRSFNDDKPYARFVEEQVAGDVLYPHDPEATVALGFLAAGPWDESSQSNVRDDTVDKKIAQNLDRDDMVMTTMSTFTSTTVQCARCHDHKFDPITQAEYYNLQAVFAGVERADRPYHLDPRAESLRRPFLARKAALETRKKEVIDPFLDPETRAEIAGAQVAWESTTMAGSTARTTLDPSSQRPAAVKPPPDAIARIVAIPPDRRSGPQKDELTAYYYTISPRIQAAIDQAGRAVAALPPVPMVYAAARDFAPLSNFKPSKGPRPVHLLRRGDVNRPVAPATPGALALVPGLDARFSLPNPDDEGSRRAALARWLTDPANVLTWRSIVNRIWHHHFGRGLADSPNDLGRMGAPPSHPELIDWLAVEFRDGGGSIKRLHRLIVTSATYRQSCRHDPRMAGVDADNLYLWRMNRTRLDAESVRDALLLVSGKLDTTTGGPSVKQFIESPGIHVTPMVDYLRFDVDSPESYRRSIYRFLFRTIPDPFMDSMDCPDASQLSPKRNASVTALQALAMLNDRFIVRQCEHFAARVAAHDEDIPAQVKAAYRHALGRPPDRDETEAVAAFANRHGMANACRLIVNTNEFLFVN